MLGFREEVINMSKEFDDFMKIVASDEFREEKAEYIA